MPFPTRTLVVAEAGVNHGGSIDEALRLVDAAADGGADYVKFQTFTARKLVAADAQTAAYQRAQTGLTSQRDLLAALELDDAGHRRIAEQCRERGIGFLSSAFDAEGLAYLLDEFAIDYVKIPSGEITNRFLLEAAAEAGRPILLSTGMATVEEIEAALGVLWAGGASRDDTCVLQCYTEYPAPAERANLHAMTRLGQALDVPIGYSDHTVGIAVVLGAVALGARVVEKHFTLDKAASGPDHAASLDPAELAALVAGVRTVEAALGDGVKRPAGVELENRPLVRKSLCYATDLPAGHVLARTDFLPLRPAGGISPMAYGSLLGRALVRDVAAEARIRESDLA